MLTTKTDTMLAKTTVLSVTCQMLGRPSSGSHKKRQCSRVKWLGQIDPGLVSVTVSITK